MVRITADRYSVGVDVGTGSVRAGVVSRDGRILAACTKDVDVHSPRAGFYMQSSEQVWDRIASCIRDAIAQAGLDDVGAIVGIGFAATCSLVLVDEEGTTLR